MLLSVLCICGACSRQFVKRDSGSREDQRERLDKWKAAYDRKEGEPTSKNKYFRAETDRKIDISKQHAGKGCYAVNEVIPLDDQFIHLPKMPASGMEPLENIISTGPVEAGNKGINKLCYEV